MSETFNLSSFDNFNFIKGSEEVATTVYTFDSGEDIYDIISFFLEKKSIIGSFYIVDLAQLEKKYKIWKENLPDVFPYYAVKCNPDTTIIKVLSELGCGFDCASKDEIVTVQNINDKANIIYANPCKEIHHLQYARSNDVELLTFDSECELHKIKIHHPKSRLVLRVQVDDSASLCKFNSKFGCEDDEIEKLINLCKLLDLNLVGVSFHVGSGCQELGKYKSSIEKCRTVYDIALKKDIKLSIVDIGGGFPGIDRKIKFEEIAKEINKAITDNFKDTDVEFIAEPGRFFSTTSHTLVCSVIGLKKTKDRYKYFVNDGVYGSFSCTMFDHAKPDIQPYNERDQDLYESTVFGPTCDSLDTISTECKLPELTVGDWIFIPNFGAYTRASSTSFNGFQLSRVFYVYTS